MQKIAVICLHPRLYQVEMRGHWAGLRRFFAHSWKIYYTFWDSENTIYIETIWHVRADDSAEEQDIR